MARVVDLIFQDVCTIIISTGFLLGGEQNSNRETSNVQSQVRITGQSDRKYLF